LTVNFQTISIALLTGIVRGTDPRNVLRNGHNYRVDIRGLQMLAGNGVKFIPASEVPGKLAVLIQRINHLDNKASLQEILGIYRDFLIIHPFVDGNGRTARILLDYMLMKSGFPPAPHDKATRDILFYSPRETYLGFINAYQKYQP